MGYFDSMVGGKKVDPNSATGDSWDISPLKQWINPNYAPASTSTPFQFNTGFVNPTQPSISGNPNWSFANTPITQAASLTGDNFLSSLASYGQIGDGKGLFNKPITPPNTRNYTTNPLGTEWGDMKTPVGIMQGLGALSSLAGMYGNFKQLGLAKEAFRDNQNRWQANYENQVQNYNTMLEDRHKARLAAGGNKAEIYGTLDDYMKKNALPKDRK